MNERDLQDLLDTDLVANGLSGFGLFLLSGASWLAIDRLVDQPEFKLTPQIESYLVISLCGLILLAAGGVMIWMKRRKISNIFAETKEVDVAEVPVSELSKVVSPTRLSQSNTGQKTPR